jgi:hypothetical protein
MRDETSDTFEWLFTTFKTCMGGHEPHVLLIGQYYSDVFVFTIREISYVIATSFKLL